MGLEGWSGGSGWPSGGGGLKGVEQGGGSAAERVAGDNQLGGVGGEGEIVTGKVSVEIRQGCAECAAK